MINDKWIWKMTYEIRAIKYANRKWNMISDIRYLMSYSQQLWYDVWRMMYHVWCIVYDVWWMVYDVRCTMYYVQSTVYSTCYMLYDTWYQTHDAWYAISELNLVKHQTLGKWPNLCKMSDCRRLAELGKTLDNVSDPRCWVVLHRRRINLCLHSNTMVCRWLPA